MLNKLSQITVFFLVLISASAADWPTYRGNNQRSGVAHEDLPVPMRNIWMHETGSPVTAWTKPAKWDAYSGNAGLQPMRDFDHVPYTTVVQGRIYYGSTVDHGIHCLDGGTGKEIWVYLTNGAVRIAPTIHHGKVYAGSDDGAVYCVNAADGKFLWKFEVAESSKLVGCNRSLISTFPCRTGVLIHEDSCYCAFSLLPWMPSTLCILDAETGKVRSRQTLSGMTFQGPFAATATDLIAMQGKISPVSFDLKTGKRKHSFSSAGGTWGRILGSKYLATGPNNQKNRSSVIQLHTITGQSVAAFQNCERIVADAGKCFLPNGDHLTAINLAEFGSLSVRINELKAEQGRRKKKRDKAGVAAIGREIAKLTSKRKKTTLWQVNCPTPLELIKTGSQIVVGSANAVTIFDANTGKQLWTARVQGDPCGLTIANGKLIASTTIGRIYAFH